MKTMLSMPRTISMTVSVSSAIQASGLLIQEKSKKLTARRGLRAKSM
jgi:hypothetical protein